MARTGQTKFTKRARYTNKIYKKSSLYKQKLQKSQHLSPHPLLANTPGGPELVTPLTQKKLTPLQDV